MRFLKYNRGVQKRRKVKIRGCDQRYFSGCPSSFCLGCNMAFTDWSIDEKKQIIDILKDCPASVRLSIRDRIKEMSAADALETVNALLSRPEDAQGDNIPLSDKKPLKDVISPSETIQGDDIGDKSIKPLKAVKSPLETKTKAGSRQTKSPGSSYKEKKSPAKPVKPCEAA